MEIVSALYLSPDADFYFDGDPESRPGKKLRKI